MKKLFLTVLLLILMVPGVYGATTYTLAPIGNTAQCPGAITVATHNSGSYSAGDIFNVCLLDASGGVFKTALIPPSSGTVIAPIVYNLTGATFTALEDISTNFTYDAGNDAYYVPWAQAWAPLVIALDGVTKIDHDGSHNVSTMVAGEGLWQSNKLYVKNNPAGHTIWVGVRDQAISINGKNYITINGGNFLGSEHYSRTGTNLNQCGVIEVTGNIGLIMNSPTVKWARNSCIGLWNNPNSYIQINNPDVSECTGAGIGNFGTTSYVTITDPYAHDMGWKAIPGAYADGIGAAVDSVSHTSPSYITVQGSASIPNTLTGCRLMNNGIVGYTLAQGGGGYGVEFYNTSPDRGGPFTVTNCYVAGNIQGGIEGEYFNTFYVNGNIVTNNAKNTLIDNGRSGGIILLDPTNAYIVNNTVYDNSANFNPAAFPSRGGQIIVECGAGKTCSSTIANNIITQSSSANIVDMQINKIATSVWTPIIDYNLYYEPITTRKAFSTFDGATQVNYTYANFATWKSGSGYDASSGVGDPLLTSFVPSVSSPANTAGHIWYAPSGKLNMGNYQTGRSIAGAVLPPVGYVYSTEIRGF